MGLPLFEGQKDADFNLLPPLIHLATSKLTRKRHPKARTLKYRSLCALLLHSSLVITRAVSQIVPQLCSETTVVHPFSIHAVLGSMYAIAFCDDSIRTAAAQLLSLASVLIPVSTRVHHPPTLLNHASQSAIDAPTKWLRRVSWKLLLVTPECLDL
jgi:hypothetical protein